MSLWGERPRPRRSDSGGTPCAPDSALAILNQRSLYPLSRSFSCKHSFAHALRAWARRIAGSGQAERRRACKEPWMTLSCAGRRRGAAIRTPLPARASLPTRATSRRRVLWLRIVRALARVRLQAEPPFKEARPPAPTICRREGSHPLVPVSHRDANSCGTFGSTPRFRRPFWTFPSEKKETLGGTRGSIGLSAAAPTSK